MSVINLGIANAKFEMRFKQLGLDAQGRVVEGSIVNVEETFNGMPKTPALLRSELNADLYNYKRLVGEIESCERYLSQKGFDKEQINQIKKDEFSIIDWQTNKIKTELEKRGIKPSEELSKVFEEAKR
jgi:hypothetical protein